MKRYPLDRTLWLRLLALMAASALIMSCSQEDHANSSDASKSTSTTQSKAVKQDTEASLIARERGSKCYDRSIQLRDNGDSYPMRFVAFCYPSGYVKTSLEFVDGKIPDNGRFVLIDGKQTIQDYKKMIESAIQVANTEPTTPPTRPPDRHAERAVVQAYWKGVIGEMALADASRYAAMEAMKENDPGSASSMVDKARQYAFDAANKADDNVPDGWSDVSSHLNMAMAAFGTGFQHLHDALDSNKPSDMAAASEAASDARDEMAEAVELARAHYVDMGGKAEDISDGTAEAKGMSDVIDALTAQTKN